MKPERICYRVGGGKEGAPVERFDSTWTFEEKNGKTTVTIRHVFDTAAIRNRLANEYGAIEGGKQTLERYAEHLHVLTEGKREITLTRVFEAPRALVFSAWTESKHWAHWWGPKGWDNPVCEVDARPGGAIRVLMKCEKMQHWMTGTFREVVAPSRLVFDVQALGPDEKPLLVCHTVVTFEDAGSGRTQLVVNQRAHAEAPGEFLHDRVAPVLRVENAALPCDLAVHAAVLPGEEAAPEWAPRRDRDPGFLSERQMLPLERS